MSAVKDLFIITRGAEALLRAGRNTSKRVARTSDSEVRGLYVVRY